MLLGFFHKRTGCVDDIESLPDRFIHLLGGHAMGADEKGKKDSSMAAEQKKEMSCGCCKNMMAKKDGMKADNKDAMKDGDKDGAKSEAKSEAPKPEGMKAGGGMGCCASMGKDAAGGGMSCGQKNDAAKSETLPAEKMK